MSHKVNLVRVFTTATGNSTPITLGAAYSQLFMTPAEAGAMDGRVYTYLIVDGNDWEMGRGAYTASGTSLARTTIVASRIAGTLGTSRITLSGTAQVRFIEAAEDMDGVRGTRVVTGTSDVLANSDQGYVVTYSNAGAIAVSLAQAGSSNLFLNGWATIVQNTGVGTVTVTSATSTINGTATLTLATGMGALIWSDGTNYRAYFIPGSKPLLAGNHLSDVNAALARTNLAALGAVKVQKFTSSGTYTPDPKMTCAMIEMVGGGGGGGGVYGASAQLFQGGGGGAGEYARAYVTAAQVGASKAVIVGAGGVGGSAGQNNGGDGGATYVSGLCSAGGGAGGKYGSGSQVGVGGTGGAGGAGDITAPGSPGLCGLYNAVNSSISFGSGNGGSSLFGGGALGAAGSGSVTGVAASGYGGGGSGGSNNGTTGTLTTAGGNGAPGVIMITEYCNG